MDNTEREQAMNEYQELYEGIELMCLCTDTYEDAEEYLKPLRELIEHYIVLEDAFTLAGFCCSMSTRECYMAGL